MGPPYIELQIFSKTAVQNLIKFQQFIDSTPGGWKSRSMRNVFAPILFFPL
jgi:hypothetical protein